MWESALQSARISWTFVKHLGNKNVSKKKKAV
jgi:hypothetical protein